MGSLSNLSHLCYSQGFMIRVSPHLKRAAHIRNSLLASEDVVKLNTQYAQVVIIPCNKYFSILNILNNLQVKVNSDFISLVLLLLLIFNVLLFPVQAWGRCMRNTRMKMVFYILHTVGKIHLDSELMANFLMCVHFPSC